MQISFLLPKCTPDNSHGRYVIELSRRLAANHKITIYSGAFWPSMQSIAECRKLGVMQRPALARLVSMWAESAVAVRRRPGDVVHVQGADAAVGNIVTAHFCNQSVRPFVRANGTFYSRFNYALGAAVEKYSMTRSGVRRIIAVSGMLRDEIVLEYGVDPKKVTVIHHGVDLQAFHPRRREVWREEIRHSNGIASGEFLALFVGGDYRRKGLLALLEAVKQLPTIVKVLTVGVSPDRALIQMLNDTGLAHRTVLCPPTENLAPFYAAADCFVLPTRYDTFSLATLEAMASGLPVVVSRGAGVAEILTHRADSLLLTDPTDRGELTEFLKCLVSDAALRDSLGVEARCTAESHSWDRVAKETVKVYEEVLSES